MTNRCYLPTTSTSREARPSQPPLWVSYYHVFYTIIFCCAGIAIPILLMDKLRPLDLIVIPCSVVAANFVEYVIHRWPMHRRYPYAEFMLNLHMIHHRYFLDEHYRIDSFADYSMIVFPPFVLNMLAFGICSIFAAVALLIAGRNVSLLFFTTVMGYYLLMQIIHVFTHVREDHWIASVPGIRYLWTDHRIHHGRRDMAGVNFNFIVPIADVIMGTGTQRRD